MTICSLCKVSLPDNGEGINVLNIYLWLNNKEKRYHLCQSCLERIVHKATTGLVGQIIQGQLPIDLIPFLKQNG